MLEKAYVRIVPPLKLSRDPSPIKMDDQDDNTILFQEKSSLL